MLQAMVKCRRRAQGRGGSRRGGTLALLFLIAAPFGTASTLGAPAETADIRNVQSIALPPVILPGGVHDEGISNAAFEQLTLSLALKGYVMHRARDLALDSGIDPATLRDLGPEALAELLPEGSTYYLLCWIDYTPSSAAGGAANPDRLRASAVLIDRNQKRILWQNFAYQPATDPLQSKMAAFVGAMLLEVASPQPAFYTPIMRQIEFENRMNRLEQGYQMAESLASPVANVFRALLSSFPERPMR